MAEQDPAYTSYLAERKHLTDAEFDQSKALDKAILTLSGGALGLSITFIKNIISTEVPREKWLLSFSWTLLGLSIVATLLSFIASIAALRAARSWHDMAIRGASADELASFDKKHQWKHGAVDWCVGTAFVCFIIGIVCIGAFVWLNF